MPRTKIIISRHFRFWKNSIAILIGDQKHWFHWQACNVRMLQIRNSNPVRPFCDSHSTLINIPLHELWVWSPVALTCWSYRLGTWSGCRSPTGSPSGVKYFSSSLASSNVSDSLWLSLCPSNCSDECPNRGTLERRKQEAKTNLRLF